MLTKNGRTLALMALCFGAVFHQAGCGGPLAPARDSFQIRLQDAEPPKAEALLPSFMGMMAGAAFSVAGPSAISDFNCFAVNVTGDGIPPATGLNGCQSPDNFRGAGQGIVSKPVIRGQSISLDVPSGLGRKIDVYGIYPPATECGGSGGNTSTGFFVGSKTVDLAQSASVVIPVSYAGGTGDVFCAPDELTVPNSGGLQLSWPNGAACGANSPTPPASSPPLGPSSVADSDFSAEDGVFSISECSSSPSGNMVVEYGFDTTSIANVSAFSSLRILWKGQSGSVSTCGAAPSPAFSAGGGTVWVFRASDSSWLPVGSATDGVPGTTNFFSATFPNPGAFLFSGKIYVRVAGPTVTSAFCSAIRTDVVKALLRR